MKGLGDVRAWCAVAWLTAGLGQTVTAGPDGTHVLWLDGANGIVFNQQRPYAAQYTATPIRGMARDSFPLSSFVPFFDVDSQALVFLSGRLGSETGDPLLNRYLYPNLPNRDHYSKEIVAVRIPPLSTIVYGSYRYTDHYSDSFDKKWAAYAQAHGRRMRYQSVGLNEEERGGYLAQTPTVRADGHLFRYSRWATTPYFFSPLLFRGIRSRHRLALALHRSKVHGEFLLDNQQRYSDHQHANRALHHATRMQWEQTVLTDTRCHISVAHDSRYSPATETSLGIGDSTIGPLSLAARVGVYDNREKHGSVQLGVRPIMPLALEFEAAHVYRPREEPYWFLQGLDTVQVATTAHRATALRTTLAYHDTLPVPIPIHCAAWYSYYDAPIWEKVVVEKDTPSRIERVSGPEPLATVGGLISCTARIGAFEGMLWTNGHIRLRGREPLSVPWNAGMQLRWAALEKDRLSAGVRLEAAGPVTQRYLSNGSRTGLSSTVEERVTLHGFCKIPFYPPLVYRLVRAYAVIRGGPLHLTGTSRVRNHPGGNPIGPALSFQIIALLRPKPTVEATSNEAKATVHHGQKLSPR